MKRKGLLILAGILIVIPGNAQKNVPVQKERIWLGNEVFIQDHAPNLGNKRLGLVINHTSSLPDGTPLVQALLRKGVRVQVIFAPEHGYSGLTEAGEEVKDSLLKNIKIFSLYGTAKKPTLEQMQEIDVFVYDIQDVGTRFYTYITTLKNILEAAAEAKLPVYVLDRPNPIGGTIIEGPLLQPEFESFIGCGPIPIRYGLTCGELALMMKKEKWVPSDVELHVVKMKNWKREYFWEDTGLKWTPTSPNIPSPETALMYPGTGLLGGLRINQGIGTLYPFFLIGAPWLDPKILIQNLSDTRDFGVSLSILSYTPRSIPGKAMAPPYKDKVCHGVKVDILQRGKFFSFWFVMAAIKTLKEKYPGEVFQASDRLTLMFGNNQLAEYIEGKISFDALAKQVRQDELLFRKKRQKYLLYF